jgi:hypothetical protein
VLAVYATRHLVTFGRPGGRAWVGAQLADAGRTGRAKRPGCQVVSAPGARSCQSESQRQHSVRMEATSARAAIDVTAPSCSHAP